MSYLLAFAIVCVVFELGRRTGRRHQESERRQWQDIIRHECEMNMELRSRLAELTAQGRGDS